MLSVCVWRGEGGGWLEVDVYFILSYSIALILLIDLFILEAVPLTESDLTRLARLASKRSSGIFSSLVSLC